ncbi:helix-turn-helix domain-containing protein [Allosphingosinicella deserti]|uniref:HTH crp-type domain-containing protein n=1 Tax=Allosphingosinicella deserti TaxID=2116704 RepID=A0A2P7QZ43_9SPHN|nr:helix-turn-helix domain-containing protein [Sphingomonas deserti]PSJ43223.1 hypothetical protein C7I55_02250 [Sphingomonas deserti]
MATSFLTPFASAFSSSIPSSVSALPFLFVRSDAQDEEWKVRAALATAAAAERADDTRRNTRGRLAYLLCELGFQLGRHGADRDASLPLPRQELSRTLDVPLCKVKRTLALLNLSQVIRIEGESMRITDWRRLCSVAQYDPLRLDMRDPEDDAIQTTAMLDGEEGEKRLTAAGDPACFV